MQHAERMENPKPKWADANLFCLGQLVSGAARAQKTGGKSYTMYADSGRVWWVVCGFRIETGENVAEMSSPSCLGISRDRRLRSLCRHPGRRHYLRNRDSGKTCTGRRYSPWRLAAYNRSQSNALALSASSGAWTTRRIHNGPAPFESWLCFWMNVTNPAWIYYSWLRWPW